MSERFSDWAIRVRLASRGEGESLMYALEGGAVLVECPQDAVDALLPGLIQGAKEIWPISTKPDYELAYQLLSVHIEEAALSRTKKAGMALGVTREGVRAL